MNKSPLIQLEKICKIYHTGKIHFNALKNVDLTIYQQEYIAILGQSGSGKSTLMHIMGCLSTPTSGRYFLSGQQIEQFKKNQLAKIRNQTIGFVFQNFNLLPHMNIVENVALPLIYRKTRQEKRKHLAKTILEQLGLEQHFEHRPNELSGGQQQRVAIARALVTNPDLILADEPTGNLDSQSGKEVIALFEQFASKGKTIIIVTHDLQIAHRTKRIIQIHDGEIINNH